jgi:hypothetical protein
MFLLYLRFVVLLELSLIGLQDIYVDRPGSGLVVLVSITSK